MLTNDMKAVLTAQKLCYAATVSPEGKPAVSPKGVRILDDSTLFLCDMNSPNTVKNLLQNPNIELNVVDGLSRRGYRFRGLASIHRDDDVFHRLVESVHKEGIKYPINSIILIRLSEVCELISPLYDFVAGEWEMRKLYRSMRGELDEAFDSHLHHHGTHQEGSGAPPSSKEI